MMDEAGRTTLRSREQTIQLNRLGREWLLAFAAVLRTSQFHDSKNKIFDDPILTLLRTTDECLQLEGRLEFRCLDDQFFLNGLWIKPTLSEKDNLFSLADGFTKMGMGGIDVHVGAEESHWRLLIGVFRTARGPTDKRVEAINASLAQGGVEEIELHRPLKIRDTSDGERPLPTASYIAVTSYAKALSALRDFTRSPHGEEQVAVLRKAQRIVCEMVDLYDKSPALFHALSLLKNFESYFYHHCVNVLILSILIGREIGIGRKEAADLGMAALLHDIGKLAIPEELLTKEGELTPEEWRRIARHPIDSAKTFLLLGYVNESVAERVLVSYQHHWASRRPKAYPAPRRPMKPSLMSEVVTVAVAYDALSTDKAYRASFSPWETLRILAALSDQGFYRKEIVDALLRVLGPLPVGSWVSINEQEEGLVAASGLFAPTKFAPLVLAQNMDGSFHWVDTGIPDSATGERPSLTPKRAMPGQYRETLTALFQNVTPDGKFGAPIIPTS